MGSLRSCQKASTLLHQTDTCTHTNTFNASEIYRAASLRRAHAADMLSFLFSRSVFLWQFPSGFRAVGATLTRVSYTQLQCRNKLHRFTDTHTLSSFSLHLSEAKVRGRSYQAPADSSTHTLSHKQQTQTLSFRTHTCISMSHRFCSRWFPYSRQSMLIVQIHYSVLQRICWWLLLECYSKQP